MYHFSILLFFFQYISSSSKPCTSISICKNRQWRHPWLLLSCLHSHDGRKRQAEGHTGVTRHAALSGKTFAQIRRAVGWEPETVSVTVDICALLSSQSPYCLTMGQTLALVSGAVWRIREAALVAPLIHTCIVFFYILSIN